MHLLSGSTKAGLGWILLLYLFLFSYPYSTQSPAAALICCPPVSPGRGQKELRHQPLKASGASSLKISGLLHYSLLGAEPGRDFGGFVSLPRKKRHNLVNIMGWDYTFRSKRQILSREMERWAKSNKKITVTDGDALQSPLRESTGESRG